MEDKWGGGGTADNLLLCKGLEVKTTEIKTFEGVFWIFGIL